MSSPSGTSAANLPPRSIPVVITVLLIAEIVSAFETTMVYNALPRFITAFQSNAADVSWSVTAFLLVAAASAALCGRLGDVYGRRKLLIIVLLLSAVGSLISLSTGTLTGVIVGRAIQGAAGAILPLCFGLAREMLPAKRVPVAVAVIAGAALIAGASGNLVSGLLLDLADWHLIFVFAAALALIAAAACLVLRPSTVVARVQKIDYVGGVLFAPAIALVLFGVTQSRSWSWGDARTLGFILVGLAILAVWAWWELRVDDPMINIRLFFQHKLALTMLATAVLALGPLGISGFLFPLMMQTPEAAPVGLGLSPSVAGMLAFSTSIIGFVLTPVSGRVSAAAGARLSLMIGAAVGVAGVVMLAVLHKSVVGLVASTLVLGISTAFVYTALPNLVVEAVPAENTSEATGVNVVTRTAFQGVATSVGAVLLASATVPGTTFGTEAAYFKVFALMGVCCLITFVIGMVIKPGRETARSATPGVATPVAAQAD
ncbi:MFS transporter [Streptosporangium sp. NPDC005286]|uniref:MFS transporter n=1 Tax=Streptosporangium sp. NPDC005286 TaxID=3154463 RepID=UPI0033B8EA09